MSDLDLDRLTSDATFALARSIHGEGADHEDHDYYRKHVGVALDAVVPALLDRAHGAERLAAEYRELLAERVAKLTKDNDQLFLLRKDAARERDAALSTIAKVREVHSPKSGENPRYAPDDYHAEREPIAWVPYTVCTGCSADYPCPTIRALGSVPSTGEGNE